MNSAILCEINCQYSPASLWCCRVFCKMVVPCSSCVDLRGSAFLCIVGGTLWSEQGEGWRPILLEISSLLSRFYETAADKQASGEVTLQAWILNDNWNNCLVLVAAWGQWCAHIRALAAVFSQTNGKQFISNKLYASHRPRVLWRPKTKSTFKEE